MLRSRTLDIGEVKAHTGLPASTLRYYEEKGLIHSTGRNGLRRLYNANILEQLALIALGKNAGFSLEEIATMFTTDGKPAIDRKQLLSKANELDRNIKQLTAMRDGLRHAAHCKAPSHLACPKFQRLLNVAGKKRSRKGS